MLDDIVRIIGERAIAAGFTVADGRELLAVQDPNWPEDALENQLGYWSNDFASLLLVDVPSKTVVEAKQYSQRAESYLDAVLVQREKNGFGVDGYLILALSEINDNLRNFIVEIESDTRFVRKHVVYRSAGQWERYQRITSLGLTKSVGEANMSEFVPGNAACSQLLDSLTEDGGRQLARSHGAEWSLNE